LDAIDQRRKRGALLKYAKGINMQAKDSYIPKLVAAIIFFYTCWAIPQYLGRYHLVSFDFSSGFFSIVFTGIAGCLIPMRLKNGAEVSFCSESSFRQRLIGSGVLVTVICIGLFPSGAFFGVLAIRPDFVTVIKYLLLFFPMSLGICLFAFLLIPAAVEHVMDNLAGRWGVSLLTTALFLGVGFLIDSTLQDGGLAVTMGMLGLFFGFAGLLLRHFWVTWAGFYLVMVINTLAEQKYTEFPFLLALLSTILSLGICLFFGCLFSPRQASAMVKSGIDDKQIFED
jgi:hypothetical protein